MAFVQAIRSHHDELEADFQQYYRLELDKYAHEALLRSARLFSQLPISSRTMSALNPAKDWDWEKETQSRILAKLDEIACIIVNMNLKKGKKKVKPSEQFQPEYVKKAKEEAEVERRKKKMLTKEEMEQVKNFWANRNPKARLV